jgi:NADH:ubiquinone oxidoreductase subunit 6 (subunit J)
MFEVVSTFDTVHASLTLSTTGIRIASSIHSLFEVVSAFDTVRASLTLSMTAIRIASSIHLLLEVVSTFAECSALCLPSAIRTLSLSETASQRTQRIC